MFLLVLLLQGLQLPDFRQFLADVVNHFLVLIVLTHIAHSHILFLHSRNVLLDSDLFA